MFLVLSLPWLLKLISLVSAICPTPKLAGHPRLQHVEEWEQLLHKGKEQGKKKQQPSKPKQGVVQ